MPRVSVTIELDLPDGVEIREYERHGDGHAFHVAWTLARPLPLRRLWARREADLPGVQGHLLRGAATWTSGASPASGSTNRLGTTAPAAAAASTCCRPSSARTSPTPIASSGTSWPA